MQRRNGTDNGGSQQDPTNEIANSTDRRDMVQSKSQGMQTDSSVAVNAPIRGPWTPLHEAAASGNLDAVKALVEDGASVDSLNSFDATPLHLAANVDVSVVEYLLAKGASVRAQDRFGNTPLHYAALRGRVLCADRLLKAGADQGVKNFHGQTPSQLVQEVDGDSSNPKAIASLLRQLLTNPSSSKLIPPKR